MNLKKIGSALTAVSMIASMATYVPVAHVHAEEVVGTTVASVDTNELPKYALSFLAEDVTSDTPSYVESALEVATYTGVNEGVKYTLEIVEVLDENDDTKVLGKKGTLTLEAATAGEEYEIKGYVEGESTYSYLDQIAYDADLTVADLTAVTLELVIKGSAKKINTDALEGVSTTVNVELDCLADTTNVVDVLKNAGYTVETSHDIKANTNLKNHYCADCNQVFNDIEDHNWVADKTTKTHKCECGKVDTDYLNLDKLEESKANLALIHEWDETKHICTECGVENKVLHQQYINDTEKKNITVEQTTTSHSVTCNGCAAVLSAAEKHDYVAVQATIMEDNLSTTEDERNGSHKCKVCSYEHKNHEYNYIWKYVTYAKGSKVSKDVVVYPGSTNVTRDVALDADTVLKTLVEVSSGGMVCSCLAVDTDHTKNGHTFAVQNKAHMCNCGVESDTDHSYNYIINSEGNKINAGDNGLFCDCGAVKETHTKCVEVYTDETNHKHFCSCGAERDHKYETNTKTHQHECDCGATNDKLHSYNKVYSLETNVAVPVTDANGVVVTNTSGTVETTIVSSAIVLVDPKVAANGLICGDHEYSVTDADGNTTTTTVVGCLAVNPNHTECEFDAFMANQKHYCACGEYSEEHTFDASGKCECGAYKDHTCTPGGTNCECTVCGRNAHSFKVAAGKKYHYCELCGLKTTNANFRKLNNDEDVDTVHEFSTIDKEEHTHTCDCGEVFEHTDKYLSTDGEETGVTAHECEVCGYDIHNASVVKNGIHYCGNPADKNACGYAFDAEDEDAHDYVAGKIEINNNEYDSDTCECGRVNPNHIHAVAVCSSATDYCRCGKAIAHEWVIKLEEDSTSSKHVCANSVQIVKVDSETKKQTIDEVTGDACAASKAHTYDEDGYCVCGLVKQDLLKDVVTAEKTNEMLSAGKYATAYVVNLEKAAAALRPYLVANYQADGEYAENEIAFVNVLTDSDKATFEGLLKTYTDLYADMEDNQSAGGAKVMFVTGTNGLSYNEAYAVDEDPKESDGYEYATITNQYGLTINIADTIKLTSGYKFAGWYKDAKGTIPASEDDSYKNANFDVTVGNGLQTFYAKAEANTTKAIVKLPGNIAYEGTITGSDTCVNAANKAFVVGEQVTLRLIEDKIDFLHIEDSIGKSHNISTENGYTFTVTGTETFTAATYVQDKRDANAEDTVYAVFMNDDVEDARVYAYGDAKETAVNSNKFNLQSVLDGAARENPNKEGYTFKGWYNKTDVNKAVISRLKTAEVAENDTNIVLIPKFDVISGLHVTIVGGQFANTEDKTTNAGDGFAYGTRVGVYAPKQDAKTGKYFSGWYIGDTRVSQQQGYYFTVNADTTIVAKFEGDEPIALESAITATISRTELDSVNSSNVKKQMVVFTSSREIKSGLTVKETGFIYSSKGISDAKQLTLEGVNGSTVKKSSGAASTRFGTYTLSMTLGTTPTADVSAVPYVIATDANGNDVVIYGDVYTSTTADLN